MRKDLSNFMLNNFLSYNSIINQFNTCTLPKRKVSLAVRRLLSSILRVAEVNIRTYQPLPYPVEGQLSHQKITFECLWCGRSGHPPTKPMQPSKDSLRVILEWMLTYQPIINIQSAVLVSPSVTWDRPDKSTTSNPPSLDHHTVTLEWLYLNTSILYCHQQTAFLWSWHGIYQHPVQQNPDQNGRRNTTRKGSKKER